MSPTVAFMQPDIHGRHASNSNIRRVRMQQYYDYNIRKSNTRKSPGHDKLFISKCNQSSFKPDVTCASDSLDVVASILKKVEYVLFSILKVCVSPLSTSLQDANDLDKIVPGTWKTMIRWTCLSKVDLTVYEQPRNLKSSIETHIYAQFYNATKGKHVQSVNKTL